MNRLANKGEIGEPCGVPLARSTRVPSGICMGATSHRSMYNRTQRRSVWRLTMSVRSPWGTLSKNFRMSKSSTQSCFQQRCRALARAVAVAVGVEDRLQLLFQQHGCCGLGNPVHHTGHTESPYPLPMVLRDVHRPHGQREVGPSTHPVPE